MTLKPIPQWLTAWEYAHRGLYAPGTPENSLSAAQTAIAAGMGIECDIQRSSDDAPMVFHDWELDRLTHDKGRLADRSAQELKEVKLSANGEPIPRLAQLLGLIDTAVPLLIELKSRPDYAVERSCACVYEELKGYSGDYAVMSFDPEVAQWFKKHSPETLCGLVMREDDYGYTQTQESRLTAFAKAQPDFLAYHIAALPNPWVSSLSASGLPLLTWTVNSPETRAIALQCADALITEGAGLA